MKQILITGGSRGLGLVIVQKLLATGWRVVSVQRQESPALQSLADAYPGRLRMVEYDLGHTESIESEFRDVWLPDDEPLHGLVNNAAIAYDDLTTNLDVRRLRQMWQVNVTAPMLLTKLAVRRMILHAQPGSMVHVSSIAARSGFKGLAMYGATKGAVESFSLGVAREWGPRSIRSNCVVPGFMETEMSQSLSAEQRQKIYRRTNLKRPTDPQSVAATIAFLLSDESSSITGQSLVVG